MDLTELAGWLFQPDTTDILRIEALDWYDSAADDPHYTRWLRTGHVEVDERWQAWLNRIANDTANGITWRRVHVLAEPLTDYLRFELGVQYRLNAQAGERIRILTVPPRDLAGIPEFFVANGERVAISRYDKHGKFVEAEAAGRDLDYWLAVAADLWVDAAPFEQWWMTRPQYHTSPRRAA